MLRFALAVLVVATPALAQSDPHQPWNDGSARASVTVPPGGIARGWDPGTRALNERVLDRTDRQIDAREDEMAAYRADRMAYARARRMHARAMVQRDAEYAAAMRDWQGRMEDPRARDRACRDGDRRACGWSAPSLDDY